MKWTHLHASLPLNVTDTNSVCICIFVCVFTIINLVNTPYVKILNAP